VRACGVCVGPYQTQPKEEASGSVLT